MRPLASVTAVVCGVALALATPLPMKSIVSHAQGGPDNSAQPQILKMLSRATAINNFVDTGPSGFSPGDLYVFSDRLFYASAPDTLIGTSDGRCILIDPSAIRYDCSITAKLLDGDILMAGTLMLVEGSTSVFAVVGGTGTYRNARGDATVKLGPFVGPHEVTGALILKP